MGEPKTGHLCIVIVTLRSICPASLFSRSLLVVGAHVRAYTRFRMTLARFYSTTKVSAFVPARITYHCLPVGKYYSNRMPRGVTIMFSFATNPIARPHRFERVGASKELQECEKRDERDVWKFAVDDFVGRRKGLCLSRSSVWIWNEILYRTRDINDWFLLKLFIHRSLLKNDNKL